MYGLVAGGALPMSNPNLKWQPIVERRNRIPGYSESPPENLDQLSLETRLLIQRLAEMQWDLLRGRLESSDAAYLLFFAPRLDEALHPSFHDTLAKACSGRLAEFAGIADYSFHHLAIDRASWFAHRLTQRSWLYREHYERMEGLPRDIWVENKADVVSENFQKLFSNFGAEEEFDYWGLLKRLEVELTWLENAEAAATGKQKSSSPPQSVAAPDEDEIAIARQICKAQPKITREALRNQMEIGPAKAGKLIDIMRDEGLHQSKKRKPRGT